MSDVRARRAAERAKPTDGKELVTGALFGPVAVALVLYAGAAGYFTVSCGSANEGARSAILGAGVVCCGYPLVAGPVGILGGLLVAQFARPFAGPASVARAGLVLVGILAVAWALGAAIAAGTGAHSSCGGSMIGI